MGINDRADYETGETAEAFQGSHESTGYENVKNTIAEKIHHAAGSLSEKVTDENVQSAIAQCEKQASEWLDQSAEYVRQFDFEQADAKVRVYVRENPGRSLLIAGAVGLIIGAVLRRR